MINDIDINEIVVSNKLPFGKQDFKYFTGYRENKKLRLLCIFFPDMILCKTHFDKTKYMFFVIKDEKKIW